MSNLKIPVRPTPKESTSRLVSLSKPVQASIRSTVLILTLPHLLSELLHNSLDAQSGNIEIWIDPSREDQSIRVEDDGIGIDREGMRQVGRRWRSSKGGDWAGLASGAAGYGYKGEGELRASRTRRQ
jgi:DNA mismatch repair protein MLH3